jgi:hypothetical protein
MIKAGKSIIPVSRITEKKYIPLRKHPRFQDGSMGLTINHPKITLTHGDDYPTLSWDDYPEQGEL